MVSEPAAPIAGFAPDYGALMKPFWNGNGYTVDVRALIAVYHRQLAAAGMVVVGRDDLSIAVDWGDTLRDHVTDWGEADEPVMGRLIEALAASGGGDAGGNHAQEGE